MKLEMRKCTIKDVEILSEFAKQNFYNAFAHMNTKEDMDAYLAKAFNKDKLSNNYVTQTQTFIFSIVTAN